YGDHRDLHSFPTRRSSDLVRDLEQAGRRRIDRAVDEYVGVVGGQRLELVCGAGEGQFCDLRGVLGEKPGEFRFRIETGANGGAALGQRVEISYRRAQPRDAALDLRGVTGKFLAERQRRRVLGVGPADLDDTGERLFLLAQRAVKLLQRRNQIGGNVHRRRDVHGGRERVVRGLAHV